MRAQHRCVRRLLPASVLPLCVVAFAAPAVGQADTLGLDTGKPDDALRYRELVWLTVPGFLSVADYLE